MDINLTQKRAVICGSTQGIGKACAIEFAKLGAEVTLVARNEESLRSVIAELSVTSAQNHHWIAVDFSEPEQLRTKLLALTNQKPEIHILVNNTGGPPGGPIVDAQSDAFIRAFTNHVICNQILAQALLPGMKRAGYGRIINIISTSVKQPIKGLGVSNTIRGAVANWAKTLSEEVARFGITVNNVLPGYTDTARLQWLIETRAKHQNRSEENIRQEMISSIPLGRLAKPEEIAYAVAFLASPAAAYINGINLPVDAGRLGCL